VGILTVDGAGGGGVVFLFLRGERCRRWCLGIWRKRRRCAIPVAEYVPLEGGGVCYGGSSRCCVCAFKDLGRGIGGGADEGSDFPRLDGLVPCEWRGFGE